MRSEGTVVGLSVWSVWAIRSTNDATYLAGNDFCAILSETYRYCTANIRGGHFSSARYAHAHNILRPRVQQPWQRRRAETCELLPIMPPSKVCPKCQAIVCKSCQHAFQAKRKAEQNMPDLSVKRMQMLEKLRKTTKRASETSKQTVHRREQDSAHKASTRAAETGEQTKTKHAKLA